MITELWLESHQKFDEMSAKIAMPEVGARVSEDESQFLDRGSMLMFLVGERQTSIEDLAAGAIREPSSRHPINRVHDMFTVRTELR